MDLRALRTIRFFVPERSADHDADRHSDGQPDAHVSGCNPKHGAQRRS